MQFVGNQKIYFILMLLGLILTWSFNLLFIHQTGGFNIGLFLAGVYDNYASSSIGNDVIIAYLAFLVWSYGESKRLNMPFWWLIVIVSTLGAFAFGFPLFLFLREKYLEKA